MNQRTWSAVDAFIVERLVRSDTALADALAANAAAGLPSYDVSPAQGKLLHLLARMIDARRILEIGTLGGYSTIGDNVIRNGAILDAGSADANIRGTRRFFDLLASEPRLSATVIQTVGDKGWDGFALAIVD